MYINSHLDAIVFLQKTVTRAKGIHSNQPVHGCCTTPLRLDCTIRTRAAAHVICNCQTAVKLNCAYKNFN